MLRRKSLKMQPPKRGRINIPSEEEQIRIISGLLKLKHFQGIWYNGGTLSVRRAFQQPPEYLSWADTRDMLALADALFPERKELEATESNLKFGAVA